MRRSDHRRRWGVVLALGLALAAPARGQLEEQPGYFPLDELELIDRESLSLEINLSGSLLALVAGATSADDPDFAAFVRGLEGLRVRIAEAGDVDVPKLRAGLERATAWLETNGWDALMRLRTAEEEVCLYTRTVDREMVGATLLVLEPGGEAVLLNVVGRLDLALLARLAESLDIPELDLAGLPAAGDDPD